MMKRHWQYFKYVMRHKWFVFVECRKLDVPIGIALLHDWDKFLPDEWFAYARCYFSEDGQRQYEQNEAYQIARLLHRNRNKNHWQFWVNRDIDEPECYPIPPVYRREMLADWRSAGVAVGQPDIRTWYIDTYHQIKLHPEIRAWVDAQLDVNHTDLVC